MTDKKKYSNSNPTSINSGLALRQRAEALFRKKATLSQKQLGEPSLEETQRILYELQVHQIELEMQNEELRRTQAALDCSYLRYFDLYNLAPVGYCTVSEQGLIMQTNIAAATMLGMLRAEMVKQPIARFIFQDDQDIHYLNRKQLMATGEPQSYELRMIKKDGLPFWVHLAGTVARGVDGGPEYRFVLSDAPGREQVEEALIESERRFQILFEKSPIGIAYGVMIYDASGQPIDYRFLDVNETYIKLIGINPRGKTATQVFPCIEKHSFDWIGTFAQVVRTGQQVHFEQFFLRNRRWYDYIAYQYKTDQFVVMFMDVTERKENEQKQWQLTEQIRLAARYFVTSQEQVRKRLSSELHDRTSPNLAAIEINLNIIATDLSQEYSTDIAGRIEDIRALIADTTASIREICTDMRPPLLDYAGLVETLVSYVQQFTQRTGIVVQFDCDNHDARYAAELESLLFRIVQEALTNCAKHAHATSVIMKLSNADHAIVLTIIDNGIGFDPALLGKNGHAGLGLLNMREMTEVINGSFIIESAPGRGTRIAVEVL